MTRSQLVRSAATSSPSHREDRGGRFDFAAVRASAPSASRSEAVPVPTFTTSDQAAFQAVPAARAHHLIVVLVVLLAYVPIVRAELDRGLEDATVKVLIAIVFIGGAILVWARWTDAFWMWR